MNKNSIQKKKYYQMRLLPKNNSTTDKPISAMRNQ